MFPPLVDLVVTLLLSLVPTLLFLGLWRGLMYLRDDAVIERARQMEGEYDGAGGGLTTPSPGAAGDSSDVGGAPPTADSVRCENCREWNTAGVTYCWNCLEELPDL